jgi:predicted secreted hydrolase
MTAVARRGHPEMRTALTVLLAVSLAAAGCSPSGRVLANDPLPTAAPPSPPAEPSAATDPQPVDLPLDEAPHPRLSEWWYYTGHLRDEDGARYGFEFVVFRAERGIFPAIWASHLALTDESGERFLYEQRSEVGPQVDRSPADGGFDLAIRGGGVTPDGSVVPPAASAWSMRGRDGEDVLQAAGDAFGLELRLDAGRRPAVLHDTIGWVDFGPAGSSYYYSRTRLAAEGTLTLDSRAMDVSGIAWFDHQWGDFVAVGAGGWDWFAVNLDDGTDLMLSLIRDREGGYPLVYGELVAADGSYRHLSRAEFEVVVLGSWTSPRTGVTYPAGWRIALPGEGLTIELEPTLADQELDTRGSTGVIYWEGSQRVQARRDGQRLGGEAYVELTGYAATGD